MSDLQLKITSWGQIALDKREMKKVMRSAAGDVRNKTARLINAGQGTGRTYRGGGGSQYRGAYVKGTYRASAPGEPPVRVSGTLRNSLKSYVYPSGEGFAVRERAFYALFLEVGAQGGGNPGGKGTVNPRTGRRKRATGVYTARKLEPRPSLDVVMAKEAQELERRVGEALTKGLTWKQTK